MTTEITVSTYEQARDVFRAKGLRQALYDEGEIVMADVLVNLHGAEHRDRRRLENRLFRRGTHERYERSVFPPIVTETLAPHVARGHVELVSFSHELMMNLAATTAGIDRPTGSREETMHLYEYMMRFIEGATLAHFEGDRNAKRREVAVALERFDEEFLAPSVRRRRQLLDDVARGAADPELLPQDVLTTLLANLDDLHLPDDVVRRETCFFLLAGAHTSATAYVRTLHHLFTDPRAGDEHGRGLSLDELQRWVHETIRLQPSSPVAMRWAEVPTTLSDGTEIPAGARVTIDLMSANRDPDAFGPHGDDFDPHREIDSGAAPWGLSFGLGMHACIGQDLAAGLDPARSAPGEERLYGLVPVALAATLDAGARPDASDPPRIDPLSARNYWASYPVVFADD